MQHSKPVGSKSDRDLGAEPEAPHELGGLGGQSALNIKLFLKMLEHFFVLRFLEEKCRIASLGMLGSNVQHSKPVLQILSNFLNFLDVVENQNVVFQTFFRHPKYFENLCIEFEIFQSLLTEMGWVTYINLYNCNNLPITS